MRQHDQAFRPYLSALAVAARSQRARSASASRLDVDRASLPVLGQPASAMS